MTKEKGEGKERKENKKVSTWISGMKIEEREKKERDREWKR